jgi:hypothetical protein
MLTSDTAVVIGTTSQTWGVLGGGNIYTGSNGILLTGANFTAVADPVAGGGIAVTSAGIKVDTAVVARKFSTNIGNGALTSIPVRFTTSAHRTSRWRSGSFVSGWASCAIGLLPMRTL